MVLGPCVVLAAYEVVTVPVCSVSRQAGAVIRCSLPCAFLVEHGASLPVRTAMPVCKPKIRSSTPCAVTPVGRPIKWRSQPEADQRHHHPHPVLQGIVLLHSNEAAPNCLRQPAPPLHLGYSCGFIITIYVNRLSFYEVYLRTNR